MLIKKLKTVQGRRLRKQTLLGGQEHIIRSADKLIINEVLFIDLINQIFLPTIAELRCRLIFQDLVFPILDGEAMHGKPRAVALAMSRNVTLI
jgi:hypothetical protein